MFGCEERWGGGGWRLEGGDGGRLLGGRGIWKIGGEIGLDGVMSFDWDGMGWVGRVR